MRHLALMLALVTVGCSSHSHVAPIPPSPLGPCSSAVAPLSPEITRQIQIEAMVHVGNAVQTGQLQAKRHFDFDPNKLPRVQFVACPWYARGVTKDGHTRTDEWAAGETFYDEGFIRVSTFEPERIRALVRWECINYYLMAIGRQDLTDVWTGF